MLTPARANLIINATFDPTITGDANAAAIEATINAAIGVYEAVISTSIVVAIDFQEMSSGLGSSSTSYQTVAYSRYRNALAATGSGSNDATAMSLLPASTTNPVDGSGNINVKTANLRAIGIAALVSLDGTVGLNTSLTNVGSPGTSGRYSLLAVTEHEIDEVLGLGSGLPSFATIFPEDLFRYSAPGVRSYISASSNAYFSIDGTTMLRQFNNAPNGGDYGDWASSGSPQVQDAFGTPGGTATLGINELTALDAIGYNLVSTGSIPSVPEPGTLVVLFSAIAGVASVRRGRARTADTRAVHVFRLQPALVFTVTIS